LISEPEKNASSLGRRNGRYDTRGNDIYRSIVSTDRLLALPGAKQKRRRGSLQDKDRLDHRLDILMARYLLGEVHARATRALESRWLEVEAYRSLSRPQELLAAPPKLEVSLVKGDLFQKARSSRRCQVMVRVLDSSWKSL
jgi:hypothetical protein